MRDLLIELESLANPEKARGLARFFKTGPGQYGQGDQFWGITVPQLRQLAQGYLHWEPQTFASLLSHPIHEARLIALLIWIAQAKSQKWTPTLLMHLYLSHLDGVNNWDLVDLSAPYLLGQPLAQHNELHPLWNLAKSGELWRERIALIATFAWLRLGQLQPSLSLCHHFVDHPHDLMHKACGWVLREVGKRNRSALEAFLGEHLERISATSLRYAVERHPPQQRQDWLRQRRAAAGRRLRSVLVEEGKRPKIPGPWG